MKYVSLVLFAIVIFISASLVRASGDQPVFVTEFIGQMDFVKGRLMQLADAMPEDKYNWSPAEGVRSVGEVYSHDAEANFYLVTVIKGTKPDMDQEKSPTDKKSALAMLEKSIEAVKGSGKQINRGQI